jgi:hypothetical protein
MAHPIAHRILRIVECNRIAIHLHLLATNMNTDKSINIYIGKRIDKCSKKYEKVSCFKLACLKVHIRTLWQYL